MLNIKWKASMFLFTSIFLVCCELYGWTTSKKTSERGEEEHQRNETIREEDFPTLREWLDDRDVLYKERLRRVDDICKKYKVQNTTSDSSVADYINEVTRSDKHYLVERLKLSQFFVSRPHQVMGCLINKVASSSIVKTFLRLEGRIDPNKDVKSPHAYAKKLYPKNWRELEMLQNHYIKFMIVRDPLERLVSCYKDKMVSNTHWSLANFRKHVKKVAQKQRNNKVNNSSDNSISDMKPDSAKSFWNTEASVSEAGSSNDSKIFRTVRVPKSVTIKPKPEDIPTFSEFLEFVLSTDLLGSGFSSHWVPYWRACTPCHFKYSVIAKLETGEDDLEYIWKRAGIDRETPIPWENRSQSKQKNMAELSDYYSSVSRQLLLRVYDRYSLDYEMFGYDINAALSLGGHDPYQGSDIQSI